MTVQPHPPRDLPFRPISQPQAEHKPNTRSGGPLGFMVMTRSPCPLPPAPFFREIPCPSVAKNALATTHVKRSHDPYSCHSCHSWLKNSPGITSRALFDYSRPLACIREQGDSVACPSWCKTATPVSNRNSTPQIPAILDNSGNRRLMQWGI